MPARAADNPILNSPYDEPSLHYATSTAGELNYKDIRKGRRLFAPDVPQVPLAQQRQQSIYDMNDLVAQYGEHLVNQMRREVGKWRAEHYPGVTSRVTRDLLHYWFLDAERQPWQKLFFAQREAVETAIWLNEIAERSNAGTHLLGLLRKEQQKAGDSAGDQLPRIAFKMATGTGKTVVMACLLLYHYLNRQEHRNDTRYCDYFLIVAPGITIKDRLGVLYVDPSTKSPHDSKDYYRQRYLIPREYAPLLEGLNARLVITNYHAFEPRLIAGNKKSPFDGKLDSAGHKREAREDPGLVLKRVLGDFKPGRRLLVINDEAHHCYLPRAKGRDTEEEQSETENARAAVWFSGLREMTRRYPVRVVYDLSATPYFLAGSGYPAYSLFPWVVSDFGLIEAIEAGLVKIPFLPIEDTTQHIDEPILRNLYEHCRDELPRKGQRTRRREDKKKGDGVAEPAIEAPPNLPDKVRAALDAFVAHYRQYQDGLRKAGEQRRDMFTEPPVFIAVCSNTTVSKELYKEIAGYDYEDPESGERICVPGKYDFFSNYDPVTRRPRAKPPTLLIDSDALENSDQVNADFKRVFAAEIEQFKREYRVRHPERSPENISEADILREVVNTVGKPGMLGSHVRCVVSVQMLSEGWDANTVTHVMGLRAFGSQLLCEQVAGRALRRRSYFLDPKTGKFPPEYAHIIGVPFKFFPGGKAELPKKLDYATLRALPERDELAIEFPNVIGYRIETLDEEPRADFTATPDFELDFTDLPIETILGNAFSPDRQVLRADDVLAMRDQEIVFWLTQQWLKADYADDHGRPDLRKFAPLKAIVARWYDTKLKLVGETDPAYRRFLRYRDPKPILDNIRLGLAAHAAQESRVLPVFNHYNRTGSTRHVFGHTSKPIFPTKRSHVNFVVADTESWEQIAAKTLDALPEVESYVKNAFLGFTIPYTSEGEDREYFPDFIARIRTESGVRFNLIIEISGFAKDKQVKKWYVENRWLPAVNAARDKLGLDPWYFVEVAEDIRHIKKRLKDAIARIAEAAAGAGRTTEGMAEVFHLLAGLPEDFYVEGREDRPPQQREDL